MYLIKSIESQRSTGLTPFPLPQLSVHSSCNHRSRHNNNVHCTTSAADAKELALSLRFTLNSGPQQAKDKKSLGVVSSPSRTFNTGFGKDLSSGGELRIERHTQTNRTPKSPYESPSSSTDRHGNRYDALSGFPGQKDLVQEDCRLKAGPSTSTSSEQREREREGWGRERKEHFRTQPPRYIIQESRQKWRLRVDQAHPGGRCSRFLYMHNRYAVMCVTFSDVTDKADTGARSIISSAVTSL